MRGNVLQYSKEGHIWEELCARSSPIRPWIPPTRRPKSWRWRGRASAPSRRRNRPPGAAASRARGSPRRARGCGYRFCCARKTSPHSARAARCSSRRLPWPRRSLPTARRGSSGPTIWSWTAKRYAACSPRPVSGKGCAIGSSSARASTSCKRVSQTNFPTRLRSISRPARASRPRNFFLYFLNASSRGTPFGRNAALSPSSKASAPARRRWGRGYA